MFIKVLTSIPIICVYVFILYYSLSHIEMFCCKFITKEELISINSATLIIPSENNQNHVYLNDGGIYKLAE